MPFILRRGCNKRAVDAFTVSFTVIVDSSKQTMLTRFHFQFHSLANRLVKDVVEGKSVKQMYVAEIHRKKVETNRTSSASIASRPLNENTFAARAVDCAGASTSRQDQSLRENQRVNKVANRSSSASMASRPLNKKKSTARVVDSAGVSTSRRDKSLKETQRENKVANIFETTTSSASSLESGLILESRVQQVKRKLFFD